MDEIISEPLGGAHRDYDAMTQSVKQVIMEQLAQLAQLDKDELLAARQKKLRSYGFVQ